MCPPTIHKHDLPKRLNVTLGDIPGSQMPTPGSGVDSDSVDSLELVVTHLFDAVRYSAENEALQEKLKALSKETAESIAKLQGFARDLGVSLEKLAEDIDAEYAKQLSVQVVEFVKAAVDQAEAKARSELSRRLSGLSTKAESEKAKAVKSLESYFMSSPLPVMETVLTVRRGDSGYEADVSYSCKGYIKYGFALATQNSKFFHNGFTFALFDKKINIPVALEKTWIRKEAAPRYEKLERYTLVWAEVTSSHTIVDFENQETQSKIRLVSSTHDRQGYATVEYTEGDHVTSVTTVTGLNKWLDSKDLAEALLRLRSELLSLEKNKAALTELMADGDNTLKSLDCEYLLSAVLKLMAPAYRTVIRTLASKSLQAKKGEVSISMLRERIALLGPSSVIVKEALGLD